MLQFSAPFCLGQSTFAEMTLAVCLTVTLLSRDKKPMLEPE